MPAWRSGADCFETYCWRLCNCADWCRKPGCVDCSPQGKSAGNWHWKKRHFLASDASPIIEYTKEVVYVNDYEMLIKKDELILKNLGNERQTPFITAWYGTGGYWKGGYDHFMLKEIFEQPVPFVIVAGRLMLRGIDNDERYREVCSRNYCCQPHCDGGCGTSWHAGLIADIFWRLCRTNVEVEYASEFRYRNPVITKGDVIVAISQSGETADTWWQSKMQKIRALLF